MLTEAVLRRVIELTLRDTVLRPLPQAADWTRLIIPLVIEYARMLPPGDTATILYGALALDHLIQQEEVVI